MGKKIKIIVGLFISFLLSYSLYVYLMNTGAREIENEKPAYEISTKDVIKEFSGNSELATAKYLNKAIEISGKITNIDNNLIVLDGKVSCQLHKNQEVELNTVVKIKGRVTGYDDLLEELKLDQCSIIN